MGESAREAARCLFYDREAMSEKGVASELEKVGEAENVGIASASKVFSDCCSDNQEDLKGKMESLGGKIAKEEYSRLVAEEEERLRKEEEERLRAEEEERLRKEEEEKARKEEEERLAKAAALREIQERLERQKAAAEARRLAAKEGDDH